MSRTPPTGNLSVYTAIQPSQSVTASSTGPVYPIAIPIEKFDKAVELYGNYRQAQGLSQRGPGSRQDPHRLSLPGPTTAFSPTSYASSEPRTPSASVPGSVFGGPTESLISFGEDENPTTNAIAGKVAISHDGRKVTRRHRKKFDDVGRAETALKRWLKSCEPCSARRVKCPLFEHHDIAALERALVNKRRQQAQRPSDSDSLLSTTTKPNTGRRTISAPVFTGGVFAANDTLLGTGQNEHLTQPFSPISDLQSPTQSDILSEIQNRPIPALAFDIDNILSSDAVDHDPYAKYQDGELFPIGLWQTNYVFACQYRTPEGQCGHIFQKSEDLQNHFESHFAFTRVPSPLARICSVCQFLDESRSELCQQCNSSDIKLWVQGKYNRPQSWTQTPVVAPGLFDNLAFSSDDAMAIPAPDMDWDMTWDPNVETAGANGSGEAYQDLYPQINLQPDLTVSYDEQPAPGFDPLYGSGFHFQGNGFNGMPPGTH